jgi:TRAP-type C4-dicarboxylate transport system substrate-binding protein
MAWAEEIERRTEGKVKITVFPNGILTTAEQCYAGVVKGVSDIGMSSFAYTRSRFPSMSALDLPLGYPSGLTASRIANAFYDTFQPKELDAVKVLYLHARGPERLHTRRPVSSLAELNRLKIRATGLSAEVMKAMGAVPVAIRRHEIYESLQTGAIEGTFDPFAVLKDRRQAEVLTYTTNCDNVGGTTVMFVVMNQAIWTSLNPKIQKIVMTVSRRWIDVHGERWDQADQQGRGVAADLGHEILQLESDERTGWKEKVRPIIDAYISEAAARQINGRAHVRMLTRAIAGQQ